MLAAAAGEGVAGADGLAVAVQRKGPEVDLARVWAATHEDGTGVFVDVDEAAIIEGGRSDFAEEGASGGAEFDLPRAAALGRPEEAPAVGEPEGRAAFTGGAGGVVVEVEPGGVGLAEEFGGGTGGGIDGEETLVGLLAVLDEEGGRSVFLPRDVGEIGEGDVVPRDWRGGRGRLVSAEREEEKANSGVGGAGAGIEECGGSGFGVKGVGDVANGDSGFVGLLVEEAAGIGGPPEATGAAHFLLGDEFGGAVGEGGGGAGGDGSRGGWGGGEIDDVEFAIGAGGGDHATIGGEARIDPAASRKFGDTERGAFDEVEFAGKGDEEVGAVAGELIGGKAFQALAGALAAGFFFGGHGFVGITEDVSGGEEFAFAAGGEVELVKF